MFLGTLQNSSFLMIFFFLVFIHIFRFLICATNILMNYSDQWAVSGKAKTFTRMI